MNRIFYFVIDMAMFFAVWYLTILATGSRWLALAGMLVTAAWGVWKYYEGVDIKEDEDD